MSRRIILLLFLVCPLFSTAQLSIAQEEQAVEQAEETSLEEVQQSISAKYDRFAKTLSQLHGYMQETDPARADLLLRVIGKSNEARVDAQMKSILALLSEENPQFADVVERQDELIASMLTLLQVLQSEDEQKRLNDEIARIEGLIEDLNTLVVDQKEVRSGTERGKPTEGLEGEQKEVTDETLKLAQKMKEQDAEKARGEQQENSEKPEGENKPTDPKEGEQKSGDSKPGETPPQEGESQDSPPSESEPNESKPSENASPPQEGTPATPPQESGEPQDPSESQPSSPQGNKPQQEPTPGREEVESALEKMQKAIEELKDKNRDEASREQDQAIAELEKAKARLEEILRQLREEEQKIMLAALEARFRKMLQMQVNIRKASGQIDAIAVDKRLPRHRARSTQLARDEQDIILEADKALILLREEGTSVAFPEAVLELREDMATVSQRLNEFKIDELTIAIEDDIIEALEEMVEALRQEMEKLEEKEQQEGEQQQQEQGDPALINLLAELKLLRSLQYRVNRRTKQYGRQIDGEQATETELLDLLDQLSVRQARIQRATYDLSTGKNE